MSPAVASWNYPPEPGELQPFDLGEGRLGVLLIHGFSAAPVEMRGLGEYLAGRGFRVHGALLAGHGTTPEDHELSTWQDWVASAQTQLDALSAECTDVFIAGHSMGGTIALLLAARNPAVRAIATTAAPLTLGWRNEAMIRVGRYLRRWHYPDFETVDLWDPEAARQLRSYARRSLRAHVQLVAIGRQARREAGRVRVPTLVMHGLRDQTIPPSNAALIARLVGPSASVEYLPRSGHGMTVDVERELVFSRVADHFLAAMKATVAAGAP